MIRVLVAENDPALRRNLFQLVASQSDMEVVDEVGSGAEVMAAVRARRPDVLLVNLVMPGCGLRLLEEVGRDCPETRVVVTAMDENLTLLRSVLAFGSLGYAVHATSRAELVGAIRKLSRGFTYVEVPSGGEGIDPRMVDPRSDWRQDVEARLERLSNREREVLEAVAYGHTNRAIAAALGVSVKSVETYRYRLAEKLGFRNRADLVRFALETGLLRIGRGDPLDGS